MKEYLFWNTPDHLTAEFTAVFWDICLDAKLMLVAISHSDKTWGCCKTCHFSILKCCQLRIAVSHCTSKSYHDH